MSDQRQLTVVVDKIVMRKRSGSDELGSKPKRGRPANGVWLLRRRAPATNGQRGRRILHRCMRDVPVPIRVGDILCLCNPLREEGGFHAIYIMGIETTN